MAKSVFDDILAAPSTDPLEKYANLSSGINLNELASIDQAKAFVPLVDKLTKGISPAIVGIPSGMQTAVAHAIPLDDILADGFPADKKIHLFLVFAGPVPKNEDQFAGGDKIINVALAVRKYFGVPGIAPNHEGLLLDIKG